MTNTDTLTVTDAVATILAEDEWRPRWGGWTKAMEDPYGNTVNIIDDGDTLRIEFGYALPGVVEVMHLDPSHGARRIALAILALATPEE